MVSRDGVSSVLLLLSVSGFTAFMIFLASAPLASGYELSIFSALPWFGWLFLVASMLSSFAVLVRSAFSSKPRVRDWSLAICMVVMCNVVFILLPFIRGYYSGNFADQLTHIGMLRDIEITSHVGEDNMYPASHVLAFSLAQIAGLEARLVVLILPASYYLLFLCGTYVVARRIVSSLGQRLMVMSASMILLYTYFNYMFLPNQFSMFVTPIALLIPIRFANGSALPTIPFIVALILLVVTLPLLHPLGTVMFLGMLVLIDVSCRLVSEQKVVNVSSEISSRSRANRRLFLIVFVLLIAWFSNFGRFDKSINRLMDWLVSGYGVSPIDTINTVRLFGEFSWTETISILLRNYGHIALYSIMAVLCLVYAYRLHRQRIVRMCLGEVYYGSAFIVFSLLYTLSLFTSFIISGFSLRLYSWPLMASAVLIGLVVHRWICGLRIARRRIAEVALCVFLSVSVILGVLTVYYTPFNLRANMQVTWSDVNGMSWFYEVKSDSETLYFDELPYRVKDALYGTEASATLNLGRFLPIPSNLGYSANSTLADLLRSDSYLILHERTILYKTHLWPDVGVYTLDDLNHLYYDGHVNTIYSNGELEIMLIYSG